MIRRLLAYGAIGWILEVFFTGVSAAVWKHDPALPAKTYLWMHPVYAGGGLLLEGLSNWVKPLPLPMRAALYAASIFGVEYTAGEILQRVTGQCPWKYEPGRLCIRGFVRLDYAPAWMAVGLVFESIRDRVAMADRAWAVRRRPIARWVLHA